MNQRRRAHRELEYGYISGLDWIEGEFQAQRWNKIVSQYQKPWWKVTTMDGKESLPNCHDIIHFSFQRLC